MNEQNFILNNLNYSKNNSILFELTNKLENIISEINENKQKDVIINQLKNIIVILNQSIKENKSRYEKIYDEIKNIKNNINKKFEEL